MMNQGGLYTHKGIEYQKKVAIYLLIDLIKGELKTLRYEPSTAIISEEELPTKNLMADIIIKNKSNTKIYYQAKRNIKDNNWTIQRLLSGPEQIFENFYRQFKEDPSGEFNFVSNINAIELKKLTEKAREAVNPNEFCQILSQRLQKNIEKIKNRLNIDLKEVWNFFKKVHFLLLTEENVYYLVSNYASGRYRDIEKFKDILENFIMKKMAVTICKEDVIEYLRDNGLNEILNKDIGDIKQIFKNASSSLRNHQTEILGINIPRNEVKKIEKLIYEQTEESKIIFLTDLAGTGKSTILSTLQKSFEKSNIPVLAIKADIDLSSNIISDEALQKTLNLPESIDLLIEKAINDFNKCVFIIDQLDVLSYLFTKNSQCMKTIMKLINRISNIKGLSIVVSCKEFERKFDPYIIQIRSTKTINIKPLSEEQINSVLSNINLTFDGLNSKEKEILKNPLYLNIFTSINKEIKERNLSEKQYFKNQDLYNAIWDLKILKSKVAEVSPDRLEEAIYVLVDSISENQNFSQPISLLDKYKLEKDYLLSESIIKRNKNTITFFHQSFFNYCFAKRFISYNITLKQFCINNDQNLFVRPQIIQVLDYLREIDELRYLKELKELIDSVSISHFIRNLRIKSNLNSKIIDILLKLSNYCPIRYHIRHLVFLWFGQLKDIKESEKEVCQKFFKCSEDIDLFLIGAQSNIEWFEIVFIQLKLIFEMKDDVIDHKLVPYILSIQNIYPDKIYQILIKYLDMSLRWNERIVYCLNCLKNWQNKEAKYCLKWLCTNYLEPWIHLDLALYNLANTNSIFFGSDILVILLERIKKEWMKKNRPILENKDVIDEIEYMEHLTKFDSYASSLLPKNTIGINELIEKISNKSPEQYLKIIVSWLNQVLPILVDDEDKPTLLSDRIFTYVSDHGEKEIDYLIVKGLEDSLMILARENKAKFIDVFNNLKNSKYLLFHLLLVEVLIKNAEKYARLAYQYLMEDDLRWNIESIRKRGISSSNLIGKIFIYLKPQEKINIEKKILNYYLSFENDIKNLSIRGISQYDILFKISRELLSPKIKNVLDQHKRKFKDYTPKERKEIELSIKPVRSPILIDKLDLLSDEDLLNAMKKYNDRTGWGEPKRDIKKGGVIELAREIAKKIEQNPKKYFKLGLKFNNEISSYYLYYFLIGLANSKIKSIKIFAFCKYFFKKRPNDTKIQDAICEVVRMRKNPKIPKSILNLALHIAKNSSDPEKELWKENYYNGDPHSHGINTVRGKAIKVYITSFLERDNLGNNITLLISQVKKIAKDPSSAVRSCLIEMLIILLRFNNKKVIDIFDLALLNKDELLDCNVTWHFIYYALNKNFSQMIKYLDLIIKKKEKDTLINGGILCTIAYLTYLNDSNANRLFMKCLKGSKYLQVGVAKVLANNIDELKLTRVCLNNLTKLLNSDHKEVRKEVSLIFANLSYVTPQIKRFILKYLKSKAINEVNKNILKYVNKIKEKNPELSLIILNRILDYLGGDIFDIRKSSAMLEEDLVEITFYIHKYNSNSYIRDKALDVFEKALNLGSRAAYKLIENIEK